MINKKYDIKAWQQAVEIAAFGMYASTATTRKGLADMLKNTERFTDHSNCDRYSWNLRVNSGPIDC